MLLSSVLFTTINIILSHEYDLSTLLYSSDLQQCVIDVLFIIMNVLKIILRINQCY